jgi:hypothetical protein
MTTQTEKIKLTNLRNDEHFQFIVDVIDLVKSVGAAVLRVEPQYTALVALHVEEDEALRKITKSALTEKIAAASATAAVVEPTQE